MIVTIFQTGLSVLDTLTITLTCAIAMISKGLKAIVTLTYTWAISNMAKHNIIIQALPTIETLGSVTMICSNKTGTLTKNEMTLPMELANREGVYVYGMYKSSLSDIIDNSIEKISQS